MPEGASDLFVGSSSEFLDLAWRPAEVIRKALDGQRLADGTNLVVHIWRDWFRRHPGLETFQILDLAAKTAEWALLVFRADDLRRSLAGNSIRMETVRDNVLFELGLLYGYLGTQRVFILEEVKVDGPGVRIAGDIGGIQRLRFSSRASFVTALGEVREAIATRSGRFFARWAPSSSLAIGYYEQALRPFITRRRDHASREPFTVRALIPFESFSRLQFTDVRQVFEGAGYAQVGPDGSSTGRPAMWVDRRQPAGPIDTVYFDIPTTLHTAQLVIDNYLSENATPSEIARLVSSQARAFARELERRQDDAVAVDTRFRTIGQIAQYLKRRRPGSRR